MFHFFARRFDTGLPARIDIDEGRIVCVRRHAAAAPADRLPWVAPGFVDIQINGYGGQEFSSRELTPEKVAAIVRQHWAFGVTALCPTLTTQSFDCLVHGLRAIDFACQSFPEVGRSVIGIHLEGPFISSEDGPRGAHPREHCRRPTWEEFQHLQEAAGGRIRLLTMSPEFPESAEFIARVSAHQVVVALGHTAADGEQIEAAVEAGARLSTHLGNGAHGLLRRHPNYIWHQLAEDRLMASLIVDGHHLPPEVVKTIVRAKSPERCILVSDVSGLAGLPPGRHASSGGEVELLPDGRLVVAGQRQLLAGAAQPIGVGVANVMSFAGIDLPAAVAMATVHPSRLLGHPVGTLRPGDMADLVLFDLAAPEQATDEHRDDASRSAQLMVRATIAAGEIVFGELPSE
ncbi:MAG TPA: amidohydrolase family protein [Pirellulales bacterium]|nr:amidohydrolase family protein [Pirellulales bacterium]